MSHQNVLVVDDNRDLAENVAEILALLNVDVSIATSGADALALAADRTFDLALVDLRLPDTDGNQVVQRLSVLSPTTEAVLMTGDATLESAVTAVRNGAFSYILKPFSPPDLLETARRALEKVHLSRERERLRLELERSERRHRLVVDAVPAFVLALDPEGRIALWNRRLEAVTGYSRAEMIGRPGVEVITGRGVSPLACKGGGTRLVRWESEAVELPESEGKWTYSVGADVTNEQEMQRRTLRAERLAAVGTMAAGLAHEVRNPLNSANLQLMVLQRRLTAGETSPDALLPTAALVQQEIARLERLVQDFLAFARPRPLEIQSTDLAALCTSTLTLVQPEAEAALVRCKTDLAADLPLLPVDPERLRQVMLNLVRNAIEAMAGGGELTVRTRRLTDHAELDIEDTGPGFADESPIFDAFFTTKEQGTGLGLTIAHKIVQDHGGAIRVRSRPGQTCFTLSLPLG